MGIVYHIQVKSHILMSYIILGIIIPCPRKLGGFTGFILFEFGKLTVMNFIKKYYKYRVMSHECHGITNHWQLNCLFNSSSSLSKKKSLLLAFCEGNPAPVDSTHKVIYRNHFHVCLKTASLSVYLFHPLSNLTAVSLDLSDSCEYFHIKKQSCCQWPTAPSCQQAVNVWEQHGWFTSLSWAVVDCFTLTQPYGVGGAVRFLVVGTIRQEERPPRGQLWMEQCLTLLKYWPI